MSAADVGAGLHNFLGVFSCGQLAREKAEGTGFYDVESSTDDPVSRIKQWQVINTTSWIATDNLTVKNIASYAEFKDLTRRSEEHTSELQSARRNAYAAFSLTQQQSRLL